MQFINNYRGIAILLIMLIHAIGTVNSDGSMVLKALGLLLQNSTVLFVVVAGYLFSFSSENFNYIKFLKHKFKTIILPYFFVSIPAVFLYLSGIKNTHYWIDMDWFYSLNIVYQYLYLMGSGAHLVTFWFIPMITLFYLFSPLIVYIKNNKLLEFAFFISLVPAFLLGRPDFSENNLVWSLYFLPPYLLGMILMHRPGLYDALKKYSASILLGYIAIYLSLSWSSALSSSVDLFFKMFLSVLLIAFSKQLFSEKNRWLNMFARLSFYLFFIHGYFTGAFRMVYWHIFDAEIKGVFAATVSFTITVLLSILSFVVIKMLLKEKSKIFVGL